MSLVDVAFRQERINGTDYVLRRGGGGLPLEVIQLQDHDAAGMSEELSIILGRGARALVAGGGHEAGGGNWVYAGGRRRSGRCYLRYSLQMRSLPGSGLRNWLGKKPWLVFPGEGSRWRCCVWFQEFGGG